MRVMHFALMVPTAGLARKRQTVAPPTVLNLEEAFGNVDVGCAVFAHCAELDQMRVRRRFLDRPKQIEVVDNIVLLRPDTMRLINHRVGRRGHLAEMDHRFRLEFGKYTLNKSIVSEVANAKIEVAAEALAEGPQAFFGAGDWLGADAADFRHPFAPQQQIGPGNFVAMRAQMYRKRPAQISVNARDEYPHRLLLPG